MSRYWYCFLVSKILEQYPLLPCFTWSTHSGRYDQLLRFLYHLSWLKLVCFCAMTGFILWKNTKNNNKNTTSSTLLRNKWNLLFHHYSINLHAWHCFQLCCINTWIAYRIISGRIPLYSLTKTMHSVVNIHFKKQNKVMPVSKWVYTHFK